MLKKCKNWQGSNLDVYKIVDASDVGAGYTQHIWKGGTYIVDSPIIANWNLEGNDFKIILTDVYNTGALNLIRYFEINKLFGIG